MEYIQLNLVVLVTLFVYTAVIGIWMKVANYVGEKLGIGRFFINLWMKTRRYK
ncbi:hypothetical protein [Alkaliphilus sp. B6464]|uniref:hypothetical protein n=1 Tax=Alkaliphilus sp. B6464 TaxID=2731219 RepID=UPI001BA66EDF|nr:hypothetical protein [Alkaliphilus sp. B6464]QUH20352.1 hypothetical protein HYG84_10875 [Alkaliphilus sp. B6464]